MDYQVPRNPIPQVLLDLSFFTYHGSRAQLAPRTEESTSFWELDRKSLEYSRKKEEVAFVWDLQGEVDAREHYANPLVSTAVCYQKYQT